MLTKKIEVSGTTTETTTLTYDEARSGYFNLGSLTTANRTTLAVGSIPAVNVTQQFNRDLAGRLANEKHLAVAGADRTLSYEYWPDGSLKRRQAPDGVWSGNYSYDLAGRLLSIDNAITTSTAQPDLYISSVSYNARGQATQVQYGNGVTALNSYDPARGWLTNSQVLQGLTELQNETYARNPAGMVTGTSSTKAGRSWTYDYDGLDRLLTATSTVASPNGEPTQTRAYAYDDADNMLYNSGLCAGSASSPNLIYPDGNGAAAGQGLSAGRPHAPTSICGTPVTYDANGNTTAYDVDGAGSILKRAFVYDGENRPLSVSGLDANNAVVTSTRFAYGPDGSRIQKVFGTTWSHYFAGEEFTTTAGNTPLTLTSSLSGDIRREVLLNQTPQQFGTTDFALKDRKSSTRVTLRSSPAGTSYSDYGPFGQPLALTAGQTASGSTVITGRGYINQRYDAEANANLQYLNSRYYDPLLGRFLTPDWWDVTMRGVGTNRYAYSGNDPINGSDPSGHSFYVSRETGGLVSTNCTNCGSSTVGGAFASAGLGGSGQGNGNYSYSWANAFGTYTIEKNYFTGNMVGQAFQRSPAGTPVSGAAIAATNASAMRHNGGGYSTYHAGLGAGQVGPNNATVTVLNLSSGSVRTSRAIAPIVACVVAVPCAAGVTAGTVAVIEWIVTAAGAITAVVILSRPKDLPDIGPPNGVVEGRRRTRVYDANGKPLLDYDKPHQGNQQPHVHDWVDGVREEPGRPYSPIQ